MDITQLLRLVYDTADKMEHNPPFELLANVIVALREKEIYICENCYKQLSKNVELCYGCRIEECGCKGDYTCCGSNK